MKKDLRPEKEERDYYFENGNMVLTEHFLKARGFCCESGCRHCPYGFTQTTETGAGKEVAKTAPSTD